MAKTSENDTTMNDAEEWIQGAWNSPTKKIYNFWSITTCLVAHYASVEKTLIFFLKLKTTTNFYGFRIKLFSLNSIFNFSLFFRFEHIEMNERTPISITWQQQQKNRKWTREADIKNNSKSNKNIHVDKLENMKTHKHTHATHT